MMKKESTKCHLCGTVNRGCRAVPNGHWCQRDGLIGHAGTIPRPPESWEIAMTSDPEMVAAEQRTNDATAAYEASQAARLAAIAACQAAGVTLPHVVGVVSLSADESRGRLLRDQPGPTSTIRLAVVDTSELLDDAAVVLSKARVKYNATARRLFEHHHHGMPR